VKIVCGDIKNSVEMFGASKFDVVVTNPPYMNQGGGLLNISDTKAISRHEIKCTLEDVIKASSKLLVPRAVCNGSQTRQACGYNMAYEKISIEPKYLQFVHPYPRKKANLILIKGARQGRVQLKMLEPLYVYDENGNYSKEIDNITAER